MTKRLTQLIFSLFLCAFFTKVSAQQIACYSQSNISVDNTCTVTLNANQISANAPVGSTVQVFLGTSLIPQPLNSSHIGKFYTAKVIAPNGNSCWGTIKIEDKFAPILACATSPQNVSCAIQNFNLSAVQKIVFDNIPNNNIVDVNIPTYGTPTVTENCGGYTLSYSDDLEDIDCNGEPGVSAKVTRSWFVKDASGNESTCKVVYIFNRVAISAVTFPADITLSCDANFAKDAKGNPAVSVAKSPQINSVDIFPNMAGFCEMFATYHDNKVATCGSTYEILRKWTVIDMCNSAVSTKNQVIQVVDKTAPVFDCVTADINATTTVGNYCTLDGFVVPTAKATDNCDIAPIITVTILNNGVGIASGYTIPSLNVGNYVIRYTATDACGNQSTCTRNLFVRDLTPPVAVCDLNTKIALSSNGKATLPAIDIDDNSLDNCCLDVNRFEIKRAADSDATYAKTLELNCADKNLMVSLRVWDCYNNSNVCMVNVLVEDKLPPVISAQDTLVDCGSDVKAEAWMNTHKPEKKTSLSDLPSATNFGYYDNCSPSVTFIDKKGIDNCGNGTYTRTWTVKDDAGFSATTIQKYTSINKSSFIAIFPKDTTFVSTAACDKFDTQPSKTGVAKINATNNTCPLVGIEYNDEVFEVVGELVCYKIIRTWKVLNWCKPIGNYTPTQIPSNPNGATVNVGFNDLGFLEYRQIIKVIDQTPPVVTFKPFTLVGVGKECKAKLTIEKPDIQDCSKDTYSAYTIYDEKNVIFAQSASFPGEYTFVAADFGKKFRIIYTATDKCGNYVTKEQSVTVKDATKPTPICHNFIAAELMQTKMVMVDAKVFDAGSYDNCTPQNKLKFRLQVPAPKLNQPMPNPDTLKSMHTFTCGDTAIIPLNDQFGYFTTVGLWVGDEAGNWDYCETVINIQDNMYVCDYKPIQMKNLAGAIETEKKLPVNAVNLGLNGPKKMAIATGMNGYFQYKDLPILGNYTVTPEKNDNPLNGVTTLDLVLISKHILNVQPITSPYQMIAADVNKNGSVTTADLVELRKMILGVQTQFTKNTSWRFVDKNFQFVAGQNPLQQVFPETALFNGIKGNEAADFVAVKIGDINGNVNTSSSAASRSEKTMNIFSDEKSFAKDEIVKVSFNAENAIEAYQMTLNFDKKALELVDIQGVEENFAVIENGVLTVSNINKIPTSEMFTLIFKAKNEGKTSKAIKISSQITSKESYDESGNAFNLELKFNNSNTKEEGLVLYQNRPNPFVNETLLSFNLPQSGAAKISILDATGRVLNVIEKDFTKGYNEIKLDKNSIGVSGVLFIQLEQNNLKAAKQMISID